MKNPFFMEGDSIETSFSREERNSITFNEEGDIFDEFLRGSLIFPEKHASANIILFLAALFAIVFLMS